MTTSGKKLAGTYRYDPLDRLAGANTTQRFYNETRIATEIEGGSSRRFFEYDAQPLAQHVDKSTTLLTTDQQASVLNSVSAEGHQSHAYSPFGHRPVGNGLLSLLGFNGERPEPVTGHYLLGQGYRAFNPVLMRFNSPDSWSPFGEGGINAYAYCDNDPLNRVDPDGHAWLLKLIRRIFTRSSKRSANTRDIFTSKKIPSEWTSNYKQSRGDAVKRQSTQPYPLTKIEQTSEGRKNLHKARSLVKSLDQDPNFLLKRRSQGMQILNINPPSKYQIVARNIPPRYSTSSDSSVNLSLFSMRPNKTANTSETNKVIRGNN